MKFKSQFLIAPAAFALLACAGSVQAQGPAGYVGHGRNVQDSAAMASAKASDSAEYATTQAVRSAIAGDSGLASEAPNLHIMTMNGRVTIAAEVSSERIKAAIMARAESVVGPGNVANQMSVPQGPTQSAPVSIADGPAPERG
jgi:hyperosmotically inducible periplasmic protein